MNDYLNFKKLLAWFVSQLNINNGIINGEKITGFGYKKKSSLHEYYSDYRSYAGFDLDCTINPQYGNYATTSNYINLADTDFNIIPEFDSSKAVISLYIGNHPPEKPIDRKSESFPITNLGLDEDEPNQALQEFFDIFKRQVIEYKRNLAISVADYSAETLGQVLKAMYDNAESREKVQQIHIFGIKYGHIITSKGIKIPDIINESGLKTSYKTELRKGINIGAELQKSNAQFYPKIDISSENPMDYEVDLEQDISPKTKKQSKAAFLQWFEPIITALS